MVYYIDPQNGSKHNDGLSASAPLSDITDRSFAPGDTVLFKRGTVIKNALFLTSGSEDGYITYSAYGEGPDPIVNPSVDASSPDDWREEKPGVWRFLGTLPSEMCNIIFNDGEAFGNLRWEMDDVRNEGEWFYTLLGLKRQDQTGGVLYLACNQNPAVKYQRIELATRKTHQIVNANRYVKIEHLTVEKNGIHGFAASHAEHIEIRHCTFRCLGGGVFDLPTRVRLGNAIEFWDGAVDCIVEHCVFEDIYDSGVTHQGALPTSWIPERLYFRNNIFIRCGMAAYEWRGPSSKDIYFENNLCLEAGGAFTMQGEEPPRKTEIPFAPATCVYVLIWRLEQGIPYHEKFCTIRNNIFCNAPFYGAAVSSSIDDCYMKQFVIDNNFYIQNDSSALVRTNAGIYNTESFCEHKKANGFDQNSMTLSIH